MTSIDVAHRHDVAELARITEQLRSSPANTDRRKPKSIIRRLSSRKLLRRNRAKNLDAPDWMPSVQLHPSKHSDYCFDAAPSQASPVGQRKH
jgi:hypothetical protein